MPRVCGNRNLFSAKAASLPLPGPPTLPDSFTGSPSVVESIAQLPTELADEIFSHLSNRDLKSLRLACVKFSEIVRPYFRFERVFISANPRNIEVFRAVAEHETFRHAVREIVWDDARLLEAEDYQDRFEDIRLDGEEFYDEEADNYVEGVPWFYVRACEKNIEDLQTLGHADVETLPQHIETAKQVHAPLPVDVAYAYYQGLLQQQRDVLASGADIAALRWALDGNMFPNLKKITLSPLAHGVLFTPLYPTPMIREFPYGFNYPIPRGWPASPDPWTMGAENWDCEEVKNRWRGFRLVTALLAQQTRANAPELVIEGNQIGSGLTADIFSRDETCKEYDDLLALVHRPGFSALTLHLMTGGQELQSYRAFRNGRLRKLLSANLQKVTLKLDQDRNYDFQEDWGNAGRPDLCVPLRSVFPVESWTQLTHFGLLAFLVKQQDLLDLLGALPETLQSVELSSLWFMSNSGSFRGLLEGIRDELDWRGRSVRPRVSVRVNSDAQVAARKVWLDNEVQDFIYGNGENPFPRDFTGYGLQRGVGIEKDAFEPRFERPYASRDKMVALGHWRSNV
ncbi:hypothetical protein GCG54_00004711 [Colletotrichum gloeosporioides]|uniref:F-box domain-containing protein n=1 Tax=Colletotrichum gloeosporioides TaxID=474922 RepID=A0A8H4FIQ1_COLGL|nr:uncharacterized protein GCG54_00004711 [Colletotrichum gloeosporioides]KAF3803540.1 hypothetical protein GCG54_00004711 [Colletotrichum gloeosporioides]